MNWELYFTAIAVIATVSLLKFIRESIWLYRIERKTLKVIDGLDDE